MCGSPDGRNSAPLKYRDGSPSFTNNQEDYDIFGEHWRVTPMESLMHYFFPYQGSNVCESSPLNTRCNDLVPFIPRTNIYNIENCMHLPLENRGRVYLAAQSCLEQGLSKREEDWCVYDVLCDCFEIEGTLEPTSVWQSAEPTADPTPMPTTVAPKLGALGTVQQNNRCVKYKYAMNECGQSHGLTVTNEDGYTTEGVAAEGKEKCELICNNLSTCRFFAFDGHNECAFYSYDQLSSTLNYVVFDGPEEEWSCAICEEFVDGTTDLPDNL